MFFLMNSKNKNAKKDLQLAYSQGNITVYLSAIKETARYLSTQFSKMKSANQSDGKKGDRNGKNGMIRNLKTRIVTRVLLQVQTFEILHHLKSLTFLAKELV